MAATHAASREGGRAAATARGALAWALGTALAGVVLFSCYLRQSRTVSVGSDGASQALQAWDLLHGNLLLHGWWVTDVSFYTTELPQYALIELARGLTADVIHVAGAMTYTLLVLTAAFLARGRSQGESRVGGMTGRCSRPGSCSRRSSGRERRPSSSLLTTPAPASRSCSSSSSSTAGYLRRTKRAGTCPCSSGSAWPGPPWRTR